MKKKHVPQDKTSLDSIRELCYAVDENGRYTRVQSSGWEAKDTALHLAWDELNIELQQTIEKVRDGALSPLAYYIVKHQMDARMLAGYIDLSSRKIKKHMLPRYFDKLDDKTLRIYAEFFRVSIDQLKHPELP